MTGNCLDVQTKNAVGITPGSTLCQTLFNYKISVNPSTKTLSLTPRYWLYTNTLGVPSGEITNVVNTGECPQTDIVPLDNGSLNLVLTNTGDDNSIVNVIYAPDAVLSGQQSCELPCCSIDTSKTVTVISRSSLTVSIPASGCGNLTISVNKPRTSIDPFTNVTSLVTTQCSKFTGSDVQAIISTAFNQAVPTAVTSLILTTRDTVAAAIKNVADSLGKQLTSILIAGSVLGATSTDFKQLLFAQQKAFNESKYNPINFTGPITPYEVDLTELSKAVEESQTSLNEGLAKYAENKALIASADVELDRLRNISTTSLYKAAVAFDAYNAALNALIALPDYDPSSNDPFGSFLKEVAKGAVEAVGVAKDFVDDAIGGVGDIFGLPGTIGNFISNLIKTVINVAIIGVVGVGGFFLFKTLLTWYNARKVAKQYLAVPQAQVSSIVKNKHRNNRRQVYNEV